MIKTPIVSALRMNWFRATVARDLQYEMPEVLPKTLNEEGVMKEQTVKPDKA